MRKILFTSIILIFLVAAGEASAQLRLTPLNGTGKIKLGYLTKSVTIDLDEELIGSNGTLPGNPSHRYTVLFRTEKDGFLYLVAKVCSNSPITNPMAACGGDRPCAMLWIKVDKALKTHEVQCEIYASCSYNYYDSKVKLTKTGLDIEFGGSKKKLMTYTNAEANRGLVITEKGS